MPKMKLCPNRKNHQPTDYKVVSFERMDFDGIKQTYTRKDPIYAHPNETQEYKTPHYQYTHHKPMDRMKRIYYRTVNRYGRTMWIRTEYWYCPYCDLVCHESFVTTRESEYIIKDNAYPKRDTVFQL